MIKKEKDQDGYLISRVKHGDEIAFDELVNKYKKRIYYLALQITNNHADALDLSQEAFIKTYRSIQKFKGKASFYTWLYRITVNLCLNYLKKKKKNAGLPFNEEIEVPQLDWWRSPDGALTSKELRVDIVKAVELLPPRQRMVFVLRCQQGLSHNEIAAILHCSVGNIKANLFQALQKLRNALKTYL